MRVAFGDLFDEFARDHESDAVLARIGTPHRVHSLDVQNGAYILLLIMAMRPPRPPRKRGPLYCSRQRRLNFRE